MTLTAAPAARPAAAGNGPWPFGRRVKNHVIYGLCRFALHLAGLTPSALVIPMGRLLGWVAFLVARTESRLARSNIEQARPPVPLPASVLVREMFHHLAISAIELGRILRGRPRPRVLVDERSLADLDRALETGRGVVFVTGHIGNWELMASELAGRGYPIATVARESYDPRFTALMERFRRGQKVEPIYRGRPGATARILRALRQGVVLGFLIDQNTRVPSVEVPFFGRNAPTPVGPAEIATRTGASVVVGTIRRLSDGSHAITIRRVEAETGAKPLTAAALTARLSQLLEERIREAPEQWVWLHRRWNV